MNDKICPDCGSTNLEHFDSGSNPVLGRRIEWNAYKCKDCDFIDSDEPDEDY